MNNNGDWEQIPGKTNECPTIVAKMIDKIVSGEEILMLYKSNEKIFASDYAIVSQSPFENVYGRPTLISPEDSEFDKLYDIFSKFEEEPIIFNYCAVCKHWTFVRYADMKTVEKCAICGNEYYDTDINDGNLHVSIQLRKGNQSMINTEYDDNDIEYANSNFQLSDLNYQEVNIKYNINGELKELVGILLGFNIEMQMIVMAIPYDKDAYDDEKDTEFYKKLIPIKSVEDITYTI